MVQQARVIIRPLHGEEDFRLHLGDGIHDFTALDAAIDYAQDVVMAQLEEQAHQAGAEQVEVKMVRFDKTLPVALGWGQSVYLGTDLTFTAVGRPRVADTH